MKKYSKFMPLILYPYLGLILFFSISVINLIVYLLFKQYGGFLALIIDALAVGIAFCYSIRAIPIAFKCAVGGFEDYTPTEAAKINFAVKRLQIPAYIFNFILGLMGLAMSVWGFPVILYAIIVDLITITLTGIFSLGCIRRLKKARVLSALEADFAIVGSFTYCLDVWVALRLVGFCKRRLKKPKKEIVLIKKYLKILPLIIYPYTY